MSANLLSVIEQQQKALEEWERVDVLGREPHIHRESWKQFVQDRNTKHTAALAAGKQALEQTQVELFGYVSEHNCEGPFRWQFHKDSKQIYYDNCKSVTAVYTNPQAQAISTQHR